MEGHRGAIEDGENALKSMTTPGKAEEVLNNRVLKKSLWRKKDEKSIASHR
jgi:hypothetical protein